jgi:thiol:disulfide interchange protein
MRRRVARVALLAAALGLLGCSRERPAPVPPLVWDVVPDADALERALARARATGTPAVVQMTASWCPPCRALDHYLDHTPAVRERFERMARLRIDVSAGDRPDLRDAVGIQRGTPQMIFFRGDGERLKEQTLGWDGRRQARVLEAALSRAF